MDHTLTFSAFNVYIYIFKQLSHKHSYPEHLKGCMCEHKQNMDFTL